MNLVHISHGFLKCEGANFGSGDAVEAAELEAAEDIPARQGRT
jgi:hypothetical protein